MLQVTVPLSTVTVSFMMINLNLRNFVSVSVKIFFLFGCLEIVQATENEPIAYEVFSRFKHLMMYFNEHLLGGATLSNLFIYDRAGELKKGASFEGAGDIEMALALCEAIEGTGESANDTQEFKKYLEIGTKFMSQVDKNKNWTDLKDLKKNSEILQNELLLLLGENSKIIFPFGWLGSAPHAIGLIIEKVSEGFYDLVVINTGDGLQYHYSQADPNNIYPWIKRLWIEFKNIPEKELFSDDSWFLHVFIIMRNEIEMKKIENEAGSIPKYFYESILTNFKAYAVPVNINNTTKLKSGQRSGSCTLSSLMASYLYYATDETTYHYNQIIIGHTILENFININIHENNADFKKLITDGFDLISRNLFKSTASSLAQQTLEYLEKLYPDVFKHAGLLGAERSLWIKNKKGPAIEELKKYENGGTLQIIKKTVDLGLKVIKILNENPVNSNTNHIKISDNLREMSLNTYLYEIEKKSYNMYISNLKSCLSKTIDRPNKNVNDLGSLHATLLKCDLSAVNFSEDRYAKTACILDTFQSSSTKEWWNYLEEADEKSSLEFLKLYETLIYNYTVNKSTPNSLDDIVYIYHLLIGVWKSAVVYDRRIKHDKIKLGLNEFNPPLIIESIINEAGSNLLTSGEYCNWPIRNNFSASNLNELEFLRRAYSSLTSGSENYLGPAEFFNNNRHNEKFLVSKVFDLIKTTNLTKEMYQRIWDSDLFIEKKKKFISSYYLYGFENDYSKLTMLLGYSENFKDLFPHYYHLLNSMIWIYTRVGEVPLLCPISREGRKGSLHSQNATEIIIFCKPSYYRYDKFLFNNPNPNRNFLTMIPNCQKLKIKNQNDLFYHLRHSLAFQSKDNIINFESWLNYLKGAQDLTLFENPYYLYITDRILNMPKLKLNDENEIELRNSEIYPEGFDKLHVKEVFNNISRLIDIDLKFIIKKHQDIDLQTKAKLIKRSVNITISLVRFIGRTDHDGIISGKSAAIMLAIIYIKFYKFSPLKSKFGLGDLEISTVNLVLTQICDIPIRNPKSFLDEIKTKTQLSEYSDSEIYRKSLARVHWFMTKIHYTVEFTGKSLSDDLYTLGFIYYPVALSEHSFMTFILKELLLTKHYEKKSVWNSIEFFNNGDIVKMEIESDSIPKITILIQLSSGTILKNGNLEAEKNTVLKDAMFLKYFNNESDRRYASQGEITRIGNTIVYLVKDYKFKENTIVLLCNNDCALYRKIEGIWNQWIKNIDDLLFKTNYKLVYDHKLYAKSVKNSALQNQNSTVITFIKDDLVKPLNIMTFVLFSKYQYHTLFETKSIQISFEKFNLKSNWNILKHDEKKDPKILHVEKHLDEFSKEQLIAKQEDYKQMVFIYPSLRLREDPELPFILLENRADNKPRESEFQVMNVKNLIIEANQVVSQGIGIKGTLVARNTKDGQRFILVPLHPNENEPSFIEKIPIVDGLPAPQTRLQRILLALYCIKAREYSLARELLHPFTSIDQNEVFSVKELEVFNKIVEISGGGPEAGALKLTASMFKTINRNKFPLEYIEEDGIKTPEAVQRGQRHNLLGKISPYHMIDYILSIRDIPEKYYIYRLFPDFLDHKLFLMGLVVSEPILKHENSIVCVCKESNCFSRIEVPKNFSLQLNEDIIKMIVTSLSEHEQNINNQFQFSEYLSIISKMIIRIKQQTYQTRHNEMFIYCVKENPVIFQKVVSQLRVKVRSYAPSNFYLVKDEFNNAMNTCFDKYSAQFESFNFAENSRTTDINLIRETMLLDTKNYTEKYSSESEFQWQVVKVEDQRIFEIFSENLKKYLITDNNDLDLQFSDKNLEKSKVLSKLKNSITEFMHDKGRHHELEVDFSHYQGEFSKFRFYLEGRIYEIRQELYKMSEELIVKTGEKDDNYNKTSAHSIEALSKLLHQRKLKQFKSLYSCYQRQSISCIQSKFTQLEEKDCIQLLKDTCIFYSNEVFFEFLKMLLEMTENFIKKTRKKHKIPVDDVDLYLDEMKKIESFNSRLKYPDILNFEFRSKKYRLRSEQVVDINNLTSIDPTTNMFKSLVIQRMMAAGKTLVLGTISVVRKAFDSTKLSILVPPSSLYQSNLSAMQARTYSFFKTKGHNFIFPRFQFGTKEELNEILIPFLESIIKKIDKIMAAREYYVLSPDSLQAFLNSYIEMLNYYPKVLQNPKDEDVDIFSIEKALHLFATIYNIFRTKGSIILDEIDMTMDPKKELNFPTLENEPYNMLAATLITDLVEFSVFDDEVKNIGLDILGNNQSSLTEENYVKYQDKLIEYIGTQLDDLKSLWSETILEINSEIISKDKVIEFLKNSRIDFMKDWIEKIHNINKKEIADALVIIKIQLWHNFKEALKGSANLNYGCTGPNRPNSEYAIPYLAANTPSPSSEFADRWETLNKTLLNFASVSCPRRIAKKMIKYIRNQVVEEISYVTDIGKTATSINVTSLIPGLDIMELNDKDETDVTLLHNALMKRSRAAIRLLFSYALDEIFDKMNFAVEQITSNALNMTSMFGSVQGYSGTIDNVNILPREVVADAYKNHTENEKNNGGISLKLVLDSEEENVLQISDETFKLEIQKLIEVIINNVLIEPKSRSELSAIIDAGAFFKNFKNKQIAEAILRNLKGRIEVVLYYDEESNQVEFIRNTSSSSVATGYISSTDPDSIYKATQTDISKRFTFYDQRHITGSDILQPKNARAIMTVGARVLLRDILQGTLRMRQFMTSQKVHLVTSVSSCNFYLSKAHPGINSSDYSSMSVKVRDILALGAFNEDEKQITENESLAFAKIDNEIRRFALEEVTRTILDPKIREKNMLATIIPIWFGVTDKKGKEVKSVRDLFVRVIKESPLKWMIQHEKESADVVLSEYYEFWIKKLVEISDKIKRIDVKNKYNINFLNDKVASFESFRALKTALKKMTSPITENSEEQKFESLLKFLSDKITKRNTYTSNGNEVEVQLFTEHLVELDLEKLVQVMPNDPSPAKRQPFVFKPLVTFTKSEIPSIIDFNIIKLNSVLTDKRFTEIFYTMASTSTITSANRIGVTSDLLELIKKDPESAYLIFTQYTWEGTHLLIQVLPEKKGLRVVLMSLESANEARDILSSVDFQGEGSTFWLCDLTGRVTKTTDINSTQDMNVLDLIPASRNLIFDALIFNGSLDIILTSKQLNEIYKKWLRNKNFENRAKFLLKRMEVLAKKNETIFAINDKNLVSLKRAARGDKDAVNDRPNAAGKYNKPPVVEIETTEAYSTPSNPLDVNEIFKEITEIDPAKFKFVDLTSISSPTNNFTIDIDFDQDSNVDDQFLNSTISIIDDWKDIEDENDINPYAGEDLENLDQGAVEEVNVVKEEEETEKTENTEEKNNEDHSSLSATKIES